MFAKGGKGRWVGVACS